jgi:hypothetical protein
MIIVFCNTLPCPWRLCELPEKERVCESRSSHTKLLFIQRKQQYLLKLLDKARDIPDKLSLVGSAYSVGMQLPENI